MAVATASMSMQMQMIQLYGKQLSDPQSGKMIRQFAVMGLEALYKVGDTLERKAIYHTLVECGVVNNNDKASRELAQDAMKVIYTEKPPVISAAQLTFDMCMYDGMFSPTCKEMLFKSQKVKDGSQHALFVYHTSGFGLMKEYEASGKVGEQNVLIEYAKAETATRNVRDRDKYREMLKHAVKGMRQKDERSLAIAGEIAASRQSDAKEIFYEHLSDIVTAEIRAHAVESIAENPDYAASAFLSIGHTDAVMNLKELRKMVTETDENTLSMISTILHHDENKKAYEAMQPNQRIALLFKCQHR